MTTLSPGQIYVLARKHGWGPDDAVIATAISLAESGGRTDATHLNTNGTTDYGLWQENHAGTPNYDWTDPDTAARRAKNQFDAHGWNPWTVFKTGAYKLKLQAAQQGANQNGYKIGGGSILGSLNVPGLPGINLGTAGAVASKVADPLNAVKDLGVFLVKIGGYLSDRTLWLRIGLGLLGTVLCLIGVRIFVQEKASSVMSSLPPIVPV